MDRRTFIKLGAGGLALTMLPLSACETKSSLPTVESSAGPLSIGRDGTRFEVRPNAHQLLITRAGGTTTVGRLGTNAGQLNYPIAVATHDGLAYVVECGNHRVQVFDAGGASVAMLGVGELSYPKGIVVIDGEILVADSRNARIVGFDGAGRVTRSFGVGVLSAPCGMAAHDDSLLVADPGLRKIVEFDRQGQLVQRSSVALILPYDVASDGNNVFVADAASQTLSVLDRRGRAADTIELAAAPTFVSFESDGRLYVG